MKKILIDGLYKNNLRIAILNDNGLEDFEFETTEKESTRGNIYLAKVSRVENSLQAAFVDYGGEKNGFLSLSEIHPDYFQIPKEDKERFMRELAILHEEDEEDGGSGNNGNGGRNNSSHRRHKITEHTEQEHDDERGTLKDSKLNSLYKSYNIGEIIKKDQLILVQVIKEERGNKGVSLTTYLSFPGRYFVLMTNTPKKIGISKKIHNIQERGKIREIVDSFGIAKTSGMVVRTAAEGKTKEELLKDYNYLALLWNQVRDKTLQAKAPAFIHREESIIKKVIREYCDSSVKEIIIEGDETFNDVNDFTDRLGYNKDIKIINYTGKVPLFMKFGVEPQITALLSPKVEMPSGAYFVIHQTEALVAIDVNSGRVTSGNNVEETAVKTNLEAAREIAKHLKLRKLAGLIVIDFIDMMRIQNRILVENEIKNSLAKDKARVHIGRISQFGLLELSRQRTDHSVHEMSGSICPECLGSGTVKSADYAAMHILRLVASNFLSSKVRLTKFTAVYVSGSVLVHIVNFKKKLVAILEKKYQTKIIFYIDNSLKNDGFRIEFSHSNEFANMEQDAYSSSLSETKFSEENEIEKTDFKKKRSQKRDKNKDRQNPVLPLKQGFISKIRFKLSKIF
jgi:ribonuclease E